MATRITETELLLPSLYLMSLNNGRITTAELQQKLRGIMNPSGEDLDILSGRSDDKFSQKVRNLKAHDTFERYGYAKYTNGNFEITPTGRKHLGENQDILKYLLVNDFSYSDITENLKQVEDNDNRRKIETFDENIVIQEGFKQVAEVAVYGRSKKLRDFAISQFTKDGKISCDCCTFNFEDFYGIQTGRGFIEIHHTKPIFKYEDEDIENTLEKAIMNLAPVCSNCHRMIHRNWKQPIEIHALIDQIKANGKFRESSI